MRQPARHRLLLLAFTLAAPAAGCKIDSRLGTSPADAALDSNDARVPGDGAANDVSPTDGPLGDTDAPAEGGATDAGAVADGGGAADAGTDLGVAAACLPGSPTQVPQTPARRLTSFEYDNTLRDILGDTSRPAAAALPFDGDATAAGGAPASQALIDGYHTIAHDVAVRVTKDAAAVKALTGCDVATESDATCQKKLMDNFVSVALRHPLDATEDMDFRAVFAMGRQLTGDFAGGARAVVEVALQSPEFLYRVELGRPLAPASTSLARPTPYEMATRLSYLLWGSPPDAVLAAAAARDELQTKEQIGAQARRMLSDGRARDVVRYFYLQLLGLNTAGGLGSLVTAANAPTFTADTPGLLLQETSAFIDEVTWQGAGDFQTLLTASYTFMNGPLAQFYGVAGIDGPTFQKVTLDARQRAGILTQASVLASTSGVLREKPTLRGKMVFERFLCGTVPPPPPDASTSLPDPTPPMTTRGRLEQYLTDPSCSTCHQNMDPVGFAFGHFDRFGLWQDTENGLAIDATGEIFETDARGKFDGAVALVGRLVQSRDAQNCFVGNWMKFGYGRDAAPEDACSVQYLQDAFAQAKGNVRELLVALTQTNAFLYKSAP